MSPFIVPVVGIVGGLLFALLLPLVRAQARRLEQRPAELPPALDDRLRRMEQALDAIAVEVERISEAQRFTTKLLSGAATTGALPAAAPAPGLPASDDVGVGVTRAG